MYVYLHMYVVDMRVYKYVMSMFSCVLFLFLGLELGCDISVKKVSCILSYPMGLAGCIGGFGGN